MEGTTSRLLRDLVRVQSFLFLWMAQGGGTAVSCVLGMAGAGFAIVGSRPRTAVWLMLAGAAGVAAFAYAYVLLQPVVMESAFEPHLSPGPLPVREWHAVNLFSVPLLLVGATLAFLTRGRPATSS